jgi:Rrf2 family iron-sulfur cluster assembly transcriptional regulator
MRLSTKGRYAVTAMLDLALHHELGAVTLQDISQCQGISLSYLEQLFTRLRREGMVRGTRGPGGGYRLALPAEQITMARIIRAVDEKVDATLCDGVSEDCQNGERCLTHDLWCELSRQIYDFLDGITLASFIARPRVREVAERQDTAVGRVTSPRRSAA